VYNEFEEEVPGANGELNFIYFVYLLFTVTKGVVAERRH
jgi:hypothetical protein